MVYQLHIYYYKYRDIILKQFSEEFHFGTSFYQKTVGNKLQNIKLYEIALIGDIKS